MIRKSNTLEGCLKSLTASEALTPEEAQAYRRELSTGRRRDAWNELCERFGLEAVGDRFYFSLPTERGLIANNNTP